MICTQVVANIPPKITPGGNFANNVREVFGLAEVYFSASLANSLIVSTVTTDGYRRLSDDEVGAIVDVVVAGRMDNPGGPQAPLR